MRLFGFDRYTSVNDDMAIAPKKGDGKLYRLIQLLAISAVLVAIVLLILRVAQVLTIGSTAIGVVLSIGVVGAGGFVALPWVRVFEAFDDKRYKITAIVFWALVGVCVILWIVCVWMIIDLVKKSIAGAADAKVFADVINSLNVIRVALIISLQFIISSYIAKNIIKYKKTLLPYQIMAGVAMLYIDFYLCLVLTAFTITQKGDFEFSSTATLVVNNLVIALFAIAFVLTIFPNIVFMRTDRRNMLRARHDGTYETFGAETKSDDAPSAQPAPAAQSDTVQPAADPFASSAAPSVDDRLQKIKELFERGVISEEEYNRKREEIINSL